MPNNQKIGEEGKSGPLSAADPSLPVKLTVIPCGPTHNQKDAKALHDTWLKGISAQARRHILFLVTVLLPMTITCAYYLLILSNQYVSETRFVIRSMASSNFGGLSIMTQGQGLARTEDDTHLVNEFLKSRDAIRLLSENDNLPKILARPEADPFYGFPSLITGRTQEDLYEHFQNFIDVTYKTSTGITTMTVRAFTAEDAQRLSAALLRHAEAVVNQLNKRAKADAVRFSEAVATAAEKRVIEAQRRIAEFRNRELVMDPGKQSAVTIELVNKLFSERLALDTTLTETTNATPDSPKIPAIRNRLNAIDQQISTLQAALTGTNTSMASKLAEFEKLSLERELAAKSLAAALSSLENARQDASRQQLYLERVVQPNIPDKSQYPKRLQSLAFTFALSLAAFWITKSMAAVILAHDP